MSSRRVVVMGAGPAGLTAAYILAKQGVLSTVIEQDDVVGGISRTATYKGYRFDIGGHRFFTKVSLVEDLWKEVLGDDLIKRSRLSRIFYNRKFFSYPLKPLNALMGLGLIETTRCMLSYGWARLAPIRPEDDFGTWVTNRFGKRLFEIFFKTYTEKVWGMPCSEIEAEWAAQRIKGLSLMTAVKNALLGETAGDKDAVVKTLIDEFLYPRLGPGMMWERTCERIEQQGAKVVLNAPVTKIVWTSREEQRGAGSPGRVVRVQAGDRNYEGDHFLSSIAMKDLVQALDPPPPREVLEAADRLRYRDFLTVALVVDTPELFPDNWIYVHDSSVKLGRIQNFNNWSPEMTPDRSKTCLGLEYFCSIGDELWERPDEELIELGKAEISELGLADSAAIIDGAVVRMPKAYPVYDAGYGQAVETIREFVRLNIPNLQLIGRNGMHRYNNQDHSMLTAVLAARNILGASYDLWRVNVDQEYHEEGSDLTEDDLAAMESTQPLVPGKRR